jgi:hypothetical protein
MNAMGGGGNMENNQKTWIQPQLIVLGRGTPEENVLAGCKLTKTGITGAGSKKTDCKKKASGTNCKSQCNALSATS